MATSLSLDSEDEFGYDLSPEDENLLSRLITDVAAAPTSSSSQNHVVAPTASDLGIDTVAEEESRLNDIPTDALSYQSSGLAKGPLRLGRHRGQNPPGAPPSSPGDVVICYPDLSKALASNDRLPSPPQQAPERAAPEETQTANDTRSPLVRFRSFPRKPFGVTDLTSGAWCELQYFYTLSRSPNGRKTRTAAMKQGTKVHQDLEDQVHTTVRVNIASKEDGFGLRIWNLIQGLRALRDTGMTRELEVWGFVDGNLVIGVIDGLSFENPDPNFVEQLSQATEPQGQPSITAYFPSNKPANVPQIYLTDVKTRGSMNALNSPALLRPAKVQLFLYQRFLSEMAADKLDYFGIFRRYGLDPDVPFSDSFIAQIGSLHDELFDVDMSPDGDYIPPSSASTNGEARVFEEPSNQTRASTPDHVKYRTLRELLPLLKTALRDTLPHGADSVGRLLAVEYRYRGDGSLIDVIVFPMDDRALDLYLGTTMEWWRADREPRGVQIEEAFKCRTCEFAGDCTWRSAMDEERLQSTRRRLASRRKKHAANG
ncbi:Exonuclease V [Colletotrichum shisoi]|uniref:Exonuclease V n=1 Tax=Colletotrichum shisoi TaxID=2078593 RepID=A0A5Q4BRZ7_9PEZI|nr:Exonuclease V [Colletotrichum shisoi]